MCGARREREGHNMRKVWRFIIDALKYLAVIGLLGGLVWYFAGDKVMAIFAVRDVDLNAALKVKGEDDLANAIRSKLKLSLTWRQYVKGLPTDELKDGQPAIELAGSFKRKKNEKHSDLPEASHSYSPGEVELQIRVKRLSSDDTICRQKFRRTVTPIILQDAGGAVTEDGVEARFRETEADIISRFLGAQLDIAALHAMAKRPDLAKDYVPVIAKAVGASDSAVSDAATAIICDLPTDSRQHAPATLRGVIDSGGPEARQNARKALECCETKKKPSDE